MNHRGFTLIEVLIVVVIIAVLAALILPRFSSQIQRAEIAEALQVVGAIKRGVENMRALTGSYLLEGQTEHGTTFDLYSKFPASSENHWEELGLDISKMSGSRFSYRYWGTDEQDPAPYFRIDIRHKDDSGPPSGMGDMMTYNTGTPQRWSCYGRYKELEDAHGNLIGCTA